MKREPKFKYLVVIQGKGTAHEKRTRTNIKLYPVKMPNGKTEWCSIPK